MGGKESQGDRKTESPKDDSFRDKITLCKDTNLPTNTHFFRTSGLPDFSTTLLNHFYLNIVYQHKRIKLFTFSENAITFCAIFAAIS
ncbi:hypothetical protein BC659_0059 [Sediminibacterium goheungense]|uniref:Uncharacterized protein n=1 Tax=Sediminibacterium goheungense TaxID=1086393 RepID=A0A4R6IYQ8_9BACT|nr:hypothetical protein BC659_0059 [Sediminibacterium goheungense]